MGTKPNRKLSLYVLQRRSYPLDKNAGKLNIHELNKHFETICIFDSNKNANDNKHTQHSQLIAIGSSQELRISNQQNALTELDTFLKQNKGWIFGALSYDLKNSIEQLKSGNIDMIQFPDLHFFAPQFVLQLTKDICEIHFDDLYTNEKEAERIFKLAFSENESKAIKSNCNVHERISKSEYIEAVNELKQHISRGDIYEINFCQEFYSRAATIDPADIYTRLNAISEAPFSAFCKFHEHYLLSSSPERFIRKQGNKITSQPIKGTIKRSTDPKEDEQLKNKLRNDLKEQNENVMIVDLVRNDLSRIATKGSVQVDELFEVYSFKQVHQLISTVSCELRPNISFTDILRSTFPMGSMTGAPKVRAMQLIEHYESTKRGLYSGAIGYISPEGNFDFSVVIRSILYNSKARALSFMVGSAITAKAEAESEYHECMLKAKAMLEVLK